VPPKIRKPMPAPATPPDVAPLPPAYFDPTLAVGGEDVKARKVETRLTVAVHVNGSGPYNFIVDSGADTSVVGLRIARGLQLPLGTTAILNGMTSRNVVDRVRVAELTLGPNTIRNLQLPALRESDLGGDGMIGIDALTQQRLMMDFEKRLIKVEDARIPEKSRPGDIIVVARRQRGQLILTHVRAAGLSLDAVIDTGTEITIGNLALRDKLIRKNRDKFVTIPVTGVTGETVELQMAKIAELQLGPITLRDVPMAFAGALAVSTYVPRTSFDYNLISTYPLLLLLFLRTQRMNRWGLLVFGVFAIAGDRRLFALPGAKIFTPHLHLALELAFLVVAAVVVAHPDEGETAMHAEVSAP